ncbi:MAG: energy transducer TonB [Pyrinomonadaceae bacterium]|nr:energy transducer TonB [Pyrinomonadaceae bacterium]
MKSAVSILAFVFSVYATVFGQTSSDLKELLGQPASEIFQADKDVLLVAEYASDGNICRLKMIGKSFDVRKNAEKIYPNLQRGSFLSSETASVPNGWRNAYIEHYEKIILRVYSSGDKVQFEFSFKDRRCSSQTSPADLKTILSPQTPQQETRDYYGKYETDEPAIITALPVPELTPEAVQNFAPETMEIQVILSADGTVNNIVMLGFLKNGMGDRVIRAVKKIIFKPALLGGQPVSQRIFIQYGIKKCDDGKICTFAREIVH